MSHRMRVFGASAILAVGCLFGCSRTTWSPEILPPDSPLPVDGYLKAHLHSGGVVIFSEWTTPLSEDRVLTGRGTRYDADRRPLSSFSQQAVHIDSIALLESDVPEAVGRFGMAGLTIWSALGAGVTVVCLVDPKSCFGSCPTFYLQDSEKGETLVAEGFSSAFAKSLEERDLDALPEWTPEEEEISLIMRNEAHETHAVRDVGLIAVPRVDGNRVFATASGRFRPAVRVDDAAVCIAGNSDCLDAIGSEDRLEYFSTASDADLAEREHVYVSFETAAPLDVNGTGVEGSEPALAIRARNTLLTTYLFYESIASLGSNAGAWLAEIERGRPEFIEKSLGLARELGEIEIQIETSDGWRTIGAFAEAGPIAADLQVVPLGPEYSPGSSVRLRMARGNWRIDWLAMAWLAPGVQGQRLEPVRVEPHSGGHPEGISMDRLVDPDQYLVTQRGDAYRLTFDITDLPSDSQFFLDSRGYYYEWMRDEWMEDENPLLATMIFAAPSQALRVLAPHFKEREGQMESVFWSSRFRGAER